MEIIHFADIALYEFKKCGRAAITMYRMSAGTSYPYWKSRYFKGAN